MTTTAVLVHGAWHGAWCFDRELAHLQAAGLQAIAVDLPGHGRDAGAFADLHGDAAHVRSVLDGVDGDVVLLGHSYGGAVITEAGVHPAVTHLVYLCALALDTGESCGTAAAEQSESLSHDGRPSLADGWVHHPDGTTTMTAEGAATCLYHDCDPGTVAWAVDRLGPQPMVNLTQTPSTVAWRRTPSTYVVCSNDQAIHPGLQEILAARCTYRRVWPTGHSPFASRPGLVTGLLAELAGPDPGDQRSRR